MITKRNLFILNASNEAQHIAAAAESRGHSATFANLDHTYIFVADSDTNTISTAPDGQTIVSGHLIEVFNQPQGQRNNFAKKNTLNTVIDFITSIASNRKKEAAPKKIYADGIDWDLIFSLEHQKAAQIPSGEVDWPLLMSLDHMKNAAEYKADLIK
jgi:hypothetical protein